MASGSDDDDVTPHLGMRAHWHESFEQTFQDFSQDEWRLEPTNDAMPQEWRRFKDAAKVKFDCACGNSWTSMRGVVIFWYKNVDEGERRVVQRGEEGSEDPRETRNVYSLRFKVYGQQCNRCSDERFQKPLWYKEEVDKVLNNVHQKIGEVFYEFDSAEPNKSMRHGRPRRSHDSARCQACREGQCSNNRRR